MAGLGDMMQDSSQFIDFKKKQKTEKHVLNDNCKIKTITKTEIRRCETQKKNGQPTKIEVYIAKKNYKKNDWLIDKISSQFSFLC